MIDIYTGGKFFQAIPDGNHYPLTKAGREVDLVSRHSGMVRGFPGEALIRALPSFRTMHWECKVGSFIPRTVDCFTRPGCVQLVTDSEEQVGPRRPLSLALTCSLLISGRPGFGIYP